MHFFVLAEQFGHAHPIRGNCLESAGKTNAAASRPGEPCGGMALPFRRHAITELARQQFRFETVIHGNEQGTVALIPLRSAPSYFATSRKRRVNPSYISMRRSRKNGQFCRTS